MMFSQKKRTQRDREAGLVFRWRGGLGDNNGGLLFAVLVALGFFGFLFWTVDFTSSADAVSEVQTAELLVMGDLTPEMKLWSDQASPFPPRWDPLQDQKNEQRVNQGLQELLAKMTQYDLPWRELPKVDIPVTSPPLLEPRKMVLGPLPAATMTMMPSTKGKLSPILLALGEFKERLPEQPEPFLFEVPVEAYGQKMNFLVTLDEAGRVTQCAPVDWQDGVLNRQLENWVRRQQFRKSDAANAVGEIMVKIGVESPND